MGASFLDKILNIDDSEWGAQVLGRTAKELESSEIAARDEFNRKNPQARGLTVSKNLKTMTLPLRPWRNNRGEYFKLGGNRNIQAHISEIPAGGQTTRHRHTTEAYIYIVRGSGYSIVNYDEEPEERIDWEEGSLFSPPVWAWHQHFNNHESEVVRYLAVQDTGLKRHLRLHRIERHPTQLKQGDGLDYSVEAVSAQESLISG